MSAIELAGKQIETNDEGFLVHANEWTEAVAEELARRENIVLTPRHWDVLKFCRQDFAETGKSPGVRRITKAGGIATKEMYELFPGGPGKLAAKLAGLAKPTGCV